MLDKNVTLVDIPGGEIWKQFLLSSPIPEYNKIGETYYSATNWDDFDYYLKEKGKPQD